jgi:serine/threonine protein kinase
VSEKRPSDDSVHVHLSDRVLAHLREVADAPDLSGTRYDWIEPLGRGGMSTVWRARDRALDRDVALKVLAAPAAAGVAERLVAEAKILARLDHPGIVPVHDVGVLPDGRVFYVMKRVHGRRLDELVRAGASEAERLRILVRVGEAVAFAHAQGVVHCDLKPSNVMVGAFGEVLVLDWGVAKGLASAPPGGAPMRVGTPGFMAPEQERGDSDAIDAQSDVHSLGALLRALLGERPPRPLAAIAAKAMQPEKAARYADVQALLEDLARYQAGEAVRALPEGPGMKLLRLYRQHRVAVWLVAAYLVARAAFIVWGRPGREGG